MLRPKVPDVDMVRIVGSVLQCPMCFNGRIHQITWVADIDTYLVMCRCGAVLEFTDNGRVNVVEEKPK
jgi:hypothetical protein